MKETKVYVDELPESCKKCAYSQINLALGVETRICGLQYGFISIDIDKFPNCPLQSLKDHDRELVKEVCEKIRKFCENNKYRCNKYFLLYSIGLNVKLLNKNKEGQKETFYEFLDQLQKEFEK